MNIKIYEVYPPAIRPGLNKQKLFGFAFGKKKLKTHISADIFINQIHIYKNTFFYLSIEMALSKDEDLYVCKRHTKTVANKLSHPSPTRTELCLKMRLLT